MTFKIPTEISARHIHISQKHLEKLFGKNYKLRRLKPISQPNQFAAKETITLVNKKNKIEKVRIIGPVRNQTQVEISYTDAIKLGIKPPIRISGDLKNTPGIIIKNTKREIKISGGVIIAKRHLHLSPEQAEKLKLKNKQKVSIKIKGKRGLIFNEVEVRAGKENNLSFQIDTDEGNAAGIDKKTFGELG